MEMLLKREELIKEGLAHLVVPKLELYRRPNGSIEPAWMPVFYNPHGVVSRDLTISFLNVVFKNKDFFFVDLLAGTGVRGIRIAQEVGGSGLVNDVDSRAYYYIRKNIRLNGLNHKVEAYNNEANVLTNALLFSGLTVEYIDVDPYGSPIPFIDSALKPIGKNSFVGVTATDTAPLACTHPRKTLTRYWNKCIKVDFEKEYAARTLIATTCMRGSALGLELVPLLTVVYRHYIRVFFGATRSATRASKVIDRCIGYLWYCEGTLERGFAKTVEEASDIRCRDGSKPAIAGKIWTCNIQEPNVIEGVLSYALKASWFADVTVKLAKLLHEESPLDRPYIRLDKLCSSLGVNMPSIQKLIEELRSRGIQCSRTHMDPRGIRASSDYWTVVEIVRSLAQGS